MKNWFSIENKSSSEVLDISIHDEIGLWGISAKEFIAELRSHENVRSINLSIHSPGGNVLDGFAIYNSLKSHPAKVFGKVEGIAASAASYILMAADHIEMPEDSFLMIHNAHGVAFGDADDMRDMADVVEKLQDSIVDIYERRTGKDRQEIIDMMKVETWMNANDALEHGFIDTISNAIDVAAKIGAFSKYFKSLPVENRIGVEAVETVNDYEKCLRDAGLSKGLATALTSRAKVVFQGDPEPPDNAMKQISEALDKVKIPEAI